ncbi:hypothetical protein LCGC14_2827780 [marine sediment metagenome]|uniref:Uncharacterized protein n=1 Tax=marine sediment metagenome TaxID=412755 RepID=A0A0F8YEZ8_9ZZZZ
MKYKLLQDLPFLEKGTIFNKGCWAGDGWGVDKGKTHYGGGGSCHNGIRVFEPHQNKMLDDVLLMKAWIKKIPTSEDEAFCLYGEGNYTQQELIDFIRKVTPTPQQIEEE